MRIIITIVLAVLTCISANADKYSYSFDKTPVSAAIVALSKDHPEVNISFIYKELESYRTSATINTDDAYEALRLIIGGNPIAITDRKGALYVEALQHGKYKYRGKLMWGEGDPVVAASVMLLNPNDSTVITYGISDENGWFSISCDQHHVLAKLSCLGYETSYHYLNSSDAGTITMKERDIKLAAVSVEESLATAYSDKTVYLPTQRQKRASQNATDLLRFMAIPQIRINPLDNSVTDNFGQVVTMFINGMEASSEELEGLLTADVRRVEYLEFPTDPRYKGAQRAINFIVQEYAYGGYTKAMVSESVLTGLASRASIFSKFSYKKMNYDLYVGAHNSDNHHSGSTIFEKYLLKTDDNDLREEKREELLGSSHLRSNRMPVTLRATYNADNVQIRNTVGLVYDATPISEMEGRVVSGRSGLSDSEFKRSNPTRKKSAGYSGSFFFAFPNSYSLDVTPIFNYTHTDDRFFYHVSDNRPIVRNADEDAFNFKISGNARKTLGRTHSLMVGANGGSWSNKLQYGGSIQYKDKFQLNFAAGMVGYNYTSSKISVSMDAGVCWEGSDINGKTQNDVYPWAHLYTRYSLSEQHLFSALFQYATNSPTISLKASDILQDNEYLYITGNPFLENSRHTTVNLAYTWLPSNDLGVSAFGEYYIDRNRCITIYSPYADGEAVIRNYQNNGNYNRMHAGLAANLKLFNGKLQLYASPNQFFYRSTGIYDLSFNSFALTSRAILYLGRCYLNLYYSTPERRLWSDSNLIFRGRDFHSIECGYSDSNWNLRLTLANIFHKGWVAGTMQTSSEYYSESRINYGIDFHPRVSVTVTYTFNYGKKIQRGNEVGEQSATLSGILK